jgi:hypothetical protein
VLVGLGLASPAWGASASEASTSPASEPAAAADVGASQPAAAGAGQPSVVAGAPPPAAASPSAPAPVARGSMHFKVAEPRDTYDGPPLLLDRGRKVPLGAYAGLGGGYTRFIGRDSGLVSFEAALLLDHRLSLGVAGYGFTRTPRGPRATDGSPQEFGAGYGGVALRYSVVGRSPVYATFGLVLGAGAVNLHRARGWDDEYQWDLAFRDDEDWRGGRFDPFLFAQPEVALNANATRWLRLGVTGGYRFTGGVGRFGLGRSDLNGVVIGGNVQLGWF